MKTVPVVFLELATAVLCWSVARFGGVLEPDRIAVPMALGIMGMAYLAVVRKKHAAPLMTGVQLWSIGLLAGLVALQLVPLPLVLVKLFSPARAEQISALAAVLPDATTAALTVDPQATRLELLLLLGCLVLFFLIREISWTAGSRPWIPVLPILLVAGLEASYGLLQRIASHGGPITGTYVLHTHFSGFLEMALPFAAMLTVRRARQPRLASA